MRASERANKVTGRYGLALMALLASHSVSFAQGLLGVGQSLKLDPQWAEVLAHAAGATTASDDLSVHGKERDVVPYDHFEQVTVIDRTFLPRALLTATWFPFAPILDLRAPRRRSSRRSSFSNSTPLMNHREASMCNTTLRF